MIENRITKDNDIDNEIMSKTFAMDVNESFGNNKFGIISSGLRSASLR